MTVRIGLDYDEPVYTWFQYAHEAMVRAGVAKPDDPFPTQWDTYTNYGITREEWVAILDAEVDLGAKGMYGLPVIPEVVEKMTFMHHHGYEFHLITARGNFGTRGPKIRRLTKAQIQREGIPHKSLHFVLEKAPVVQKLDLDYFLDDGPHNFVDVRSVLPQGTYLLNATWNEDLRIPKRWRVNSTVEFLDKVYRAHGSFPSPIRKRVLV